MSSLSIILSPTLYTLCIFFFFTDPATTEIYTLSLHDALPIWELTPAVTDRVIDFYRPKHDHIPRVFAAENPKVVVHQDRKSTRLNSSHEWISYAVFCLKKKKTKQLKNPRIILTYMNNIIIIMQ